MKSLLPLLPLLPVAALAVAITALVIATRNSTRRKPHRRLWRATATLLWAGVLAQAAFMVSPSRIEPDGTLYEPLFWLLPAGWALLAVGTAAALATGMLARLRRRAASPAAG